MKDIVCIYDNNEKYAKKLTNLAIKNYGKDYIFLTFSNIQSLIDYTENNKVKASLIENTNIKDLSNVKCSAYFILVDNKKSEELSGNIKYIFKFQSAEEVLKIVIGSIKSDIVEAVETNSKIFTFYSPYQTKSKTDKIQKLYKLLSKDKRVLIVSLDEFSNFKSDKGMSNIIYKYKDNGITKDYVLSQINSDNGIEKIGSVKFPEDLSVVSNYELCNIILNLKIAGYDYIFVDADESFVNNQYLFADSNKVVVIDNNLKDNTKVDTFIKYIEERKMINMKKLYHITKEKEDKKGLEGILKDILKNA